MPLLVGELEHRCARAVPGAVHEGVDAPPAGHGRVEKPLQVVVRLVRAGDADAAELGSELFALPGRRQDRDGEPVGSQPPAPPRLPSRSRLP